VDLLKVIKMALIHDIVEIDAGDTFLYDVAGNRDKAEREKKAAERIFGLLPDDQRADMRALWEEFEKKETPEARFAGAVDRLHPFLHNIYTQGRAWREHGISAKQVLNRNRPIEDGAPELWDMAQKLVEEAVAKGHVARD
jgi:putative hydrolase of HD superfamily